MLVGNPQAQPWLHYELFGFQGPFLPLYGKGEIAFCNH